MRVALQLTENRSALANIRVRRSLHPKSMLSMNAAAASVTFCLMS